MIERDLVGQQFGPYYIEAIVGRGTVGVVYRAINGQEEPIALKTFEPSATAEQELLLTRFEREAHAMARFKHPNIVPVLDTGQIDGKAYLAMPLIQAQPLDAVLKKKNRFNEMEATEIGWQIADALHHAYEHEVIHRDVKPSNVLLTPDGHAILTDFGVAYAIDCPGLTQVGHIVGTPAYMSPEQALQNKQIDCQADLYSLGVILYRMVTGRLPFRGTSIEMLHAHVYDEPPTPSSVTNVSPEMEAIILRAMAKDPADRFPDGRTMARELLELNKLIQERTSQEKSWPALIKRWLSKFKLTSV